MTKQVRQSIAPTHILGSTGTVEGSDLGFRSLTTFPFPNMPTVAGNPIVARGSNSDGHFVRFADGTQRCWNKVSADETGEFSGTARLSGQWSFPQPFVSAGGGSYVMVQAPVHSSGEFIGCSRTDLRASGATSALSLTGTTYSLFFEPGSVSTVTASVSNIVIIADGRWF